MSGNLLKAGGHVTRWVSLTDAWGQSEASLGLTLEWGHESQS